MPGTGYMEAKYESIPGNETNTPTLSTKDTFFPLISFDLKPGVSPLERDDELRGVDEPIAILPEAYAPTWDYESRAYPDLTGWFLKLLLGAPVTTAGNGVITDPDAVAVPAGAYRHVWTAPFGPAGVSPLTAQMIAAYKDQSVFYKLKGAAADSLSIDSPESGGVRVKANGPGLYLSRVADPSLTTAYEALTVPTFERGHLQVSTWGVGGVTATSEDFNLAVTNPVEPVRSLGVASRSPDVMEKGEAPITFTGSIPKRQLGTTDYDALVNSTGFAAKVRWQTAGSFITGSYPYGLWCQFLNCQYTDGGPEPLAGKRRLGASFDFKSTYAGVAGSTVITLTNSTPSYA